MWAWYAHGGTNGRPLGAMRIAMPSPQTPDCRGGVFAVFAKIPPPIRSPAAHPIEASLPRGDSPMVMSARVVFVATWRAAPRFRCRVAIRLLPFRKAFRCLKNVSIKHLQLFEDRSDAAHRVVQKRAQTPHPI